MSVGLEHEAAQPTSRPSKGLSRLVIKAAQGSREGEGISLAAGLIKA